MDATNSVSINGGGYSAQISLLGGQLLRLKHHEDELVVPAGDSTDGAFPGAVLAPWPNRTQGGMYSYAGQDYALPVNEEATGAALHGLMVDLPLHVQAHKDTEVQLQGFLEPTEGYPFGLDIALIYRVSADIGLSATLMARYRPQVEPELTADELAEATDAPAAEDLPLSEPLEPETSPDADSGTDAGTAADADEASVETDEEPAAEQDQAEPDLAQDDDVAAAAPQTAPFGAGFHPYLTAGGASLTECRLRLPARTVLKTSPDGAVTGRETVSGDFDLTNGPLLAGRRIDHAFTDLPPEGWTAELVHGPSGFVVRMIADSPWVQVYTGERIDRAGVAIEPMSCPPDALNSGEDLVHLAPGEWFRMGYSIEAIRVD
ncbi:aldose epimerase family protein [Nesterenkonia halotolerans]|uniref:Aldose 1-epimerase n=1 Tax=Nesterenkonia halotolerans TaxID=225325 RepID=A0ABR9J769_9MICC|nr:hypothetical protein [Nesterenkonia halotolerans]MBE1514828.1 aldose 1-epimerase [Nesterenkonia halotolerans]